MTMSLHSHRRIEGVESWKQEHRASNGGEVRYDFIQRSSETWTTGNISMRDLCEQQLPTAEILVVFLPEMLDILSLPGHQALFQRFKISSAFQGAVVHDASGYFACQDTRDADGNLESFSSQTRLLVKESVDTTGHSISSRDISSSYKWHRLGVSLTWTPFESLFVLCFGLPLSLQHSLLTPQVTLDDPFSFHAIFIENTLNLYDKAIWSWRDLVRDLELNRTPSHDPHPDYIKMHEIARHVVHCSETLATAIEGMNSIVQEHEIFFQENPSFPPGSIMRSKGTRRTFRSHITLFHCLFLRSKALEKRLISETNLVLFCSAFNTVAQHDSHIAVKIGEATQVDSAAMRTISVLGLAFLPGTFICALFSMSFFEYSPATATEPQQWSVSEKFWIFWVVAVPVTLVTVACWVLWQKKFSKYSNR